MLYDGSNVKLQKLQQFRNPSAMSQQYFPTAEEPSSVDVLHELVLLCSTKRSCLVRPEAMWKCLRWFDRRQIRLIFSFSDFCDLELVGEDLTAPHLVIDDTASILLTQLRTVFRQEGFLNFDRPRTKCFLSRNVLTDSAMQSGGPGSSENDLL